MAGEKKRKIEVAKPSDNITRLPTEHYSEEFAKADPKELSARSCVRYDEDGHRFEIHSLGRLVYIDWPSMEAVYADDGETVSSSLRILLGRLILEGTLVVSGGSFFPFRDMPDGDLYIQPFTGRCINRLAYMFKSADDFSKAAEELGGTLGGDGDASADFEFVDGLYVRLIVWEADDEFPPSAQFLFSDNTKHAFSTYDLAEVGGELLNQLKAAGKRVL